MNDVILHNMAVSAAALAITKILGELVEFPEFKDWSEEEQIAATSAVLDVLRKVVS